LQDGKPPADQNVTLDDLDRAPESIPPLPSDVPVTINQYANKLAEVGDKKENLSAQVEAETARALNDLIRPSANKAFYFMWAYCGAVFAILILHGLSYKGFHLPESTLNFLVGTTAIAVFGLVGMVLTGIFHGGRK